MFISPTFISAVLAIALAPPPVAPSQIAAVTPDSARTPEPGDSRWLAGDGPTVEFNDGVYTAGFCRVQTPLPEGYPAPTSPGVIELKTYPSVRRAFVEGDGNANKGTNSAFWPLFSHIKERDIAMTSPVEIDLVGMDEGDSAPDEWTMSFLYRSADLGPTGEDGKVKVIDSPPITVVSLGFRGGYSMKNVSAQLEALRDWLAEDGLAFQPAGDARVLHYNGPSRWFGWRWGEVQIPVTPRPTLDDIAAAEVVPDIQTGE